MAYTAISITPEARDRLRETTVAFTSPAGRRLTLSEVIVASCALAQQHPDEFTQRLTGGGPR
jgi:hypothetical protein